MDWDVLSVQAITGQAFANANELTSGQSSRLGSIDKRLIAGGTYYLTGWARKTTAGGVLTVGLETTAPDGSGLTTTMYTVTTTATNTWYQYSGEITIPAGHSLGRCIATATGGTVQYASFFCKPHAPSATRNIGILADLDRNIPSTLVGADTSNIFIDPNLDDSVCYTSATLTYGTEWDFDPKGDGSQASTGRIRIKSGYSGDVKVSTDYLTTSCEPGSEYIVSCETQLGSGTGGLAAVYYIWYYKNSSNVWTARTAEAQLGSDNTTTTLVQQSGVLTCPSNANALGLIFRKSNSGGVAKHAYFSSPVIRKAANGLIPDGTLDGAALIDDTVSTTKITYGETLQGQNLNVSNNPARTGTTWEGGIIYTTNSTTPSGSNGSLCYVTAVEVAQIDGGASTTYTGVMGFVAPATFPYCLIQAHIKGIQNTDGASICDVIVSFKFNAGAFTILDCQHRGDLIPDVRVAKTAGGLPCIILGQTTTVWANAMFTLAHLQLSGTSVYGPDHVLWDGFRTNSLTGYTDTATCVAF